MSLDRRKPLDHDFLESIRDRIEVVKVIDKLQGHIEDPAKHPMLSSQIKAADILLKKCIPDLKAIEHTGDLGKRELTREELIERLTNLHAGTARPNERSGVGGTGAADGAPEVQH